MVVTTVTTSQETTKFEAILRIISDAPIHVIMTPVWACDNMTSPTKSEVLMQPLAVRIH